MIKNFLIAIYLIFIAEYSYAHGLIQVTGVKHENGYIDVKIYTDKKSFLNEDMAVESIRKKATKNETKIPISKIHEGTIAIVVFHDENGDGKMNTGLFWRPKEGYAFSNNYKPKAKPNFSKAKIYLEHNKPVLIDLNY
tara:strand:+ start:153 stop:566 length:414 start_codon:yes stop_codon:yes gene_type:complete